MPGYLNNDGSELVGGLLPSGVGQALQVDSLGNLLVKLAAWATAANNPLIVEQNVQNWMRSGQGFSASTDLITGANTAYYAMSIFNPSSAKNILITRFVAVIQAASTNFDAFLTTVDPAFATALTPLNLKAGSATTSAASVTATPGSANIGSLPASKKFRETVTPAGMECDILKNGTVILLPAGSANGASLYLYNPGANDKFSFFADWIEF